MDKKTAETIVKVFGIIGIVLSAIGILTGLALLLGGTMFLGVLSAMGDEAIAGVLGGLISVAGVIAIIVSAVAIWIYVQLMKYVNWARILLLVFAILGFIGSLFSFPFSIINLVYYGAFIYFFAIDKTVVSLYK
jgi:hypothetical protein